MNQDKKKFSDDVTTVAKRFLDWKNADVKSGIIVKGKLTTITTHVKHMLSYLQGDVKVSDIHKEIFLGYYNLSREINSTVNELIQIESMFKSSVGWN